MAIRQLKITYMALIIFLLANAALDYCFPFLL